MAQSRNRKKKKVQPQTNKVDLSQFKKAIRSFLETTETPEVYDLISEKDFSLLFEIRSIAYVLHLGDISPIEDIVSRSKFKKSITKELNELLKKETICLDEKVFTMGELATIGCTLHFVYENPNDKLPLSNYDAIHNKLKPFFDSMESSGKKKHSSYAAMFFMGGVPMAVNRLVKQYNQLDCNFMVFTVKNLFHKGFHDPSSMRTIEGIRRGKTNHVYIHCQPRDDKTYIDNGFKKQLFRVGNVSHHDGVWYAEINIEKLCTKNTNLTFNKKLQVKVFIQKHAIIRLEERVDNVMPSYTSEAVADSVARINNNKSSIVEKENNQFLIPYYLQDMKIGYLLSETIFSEAEPFVMIRTFLLLPNFGTPEGNKLSRLLGHSKLDSKHFKLDRLSTYSNSDLIESEEFIEIFKQCKIDHLLEFKHKSFAYQKVYIDDEEQKKYVAKRIVGDKMEQYFELASEEDDLYELTSETDENNSSINRDDTVTAES